MQIMHLNLKLINVFDTFNVFITVAVKVQVNAGGVGFWEIALTDIQAFIPASLIQDVGLLHHALIYTAQRRKRDRIYIHGD